MLQNSRKIKFLLIAFAYLLLHSCGINRHLTEDDLILRKNQLKVSSDKSFSNKNILRDEISTLIIQKPNTYLLNAPYKVWLYNLRYKTYQKDTTSFQIRTNFVEAPVLFDTALAQKSIDNIRGLLKNQGYFNAQVNLDVKVRKSNKVYANYQVNTGNSLLINEVNFKVSDPIINNIIQTAPTQNKLQKGTVYTHFLVAEERLRIVSMLKNWGYYNFNNNNITFELDTTNVVLEVKDELTGIVKTRNAVNITIDIHENKTNNAFKVFTIDKVIVYPDYNDSVANYNPEKLQEKVVNNIDFLYSQPYINANIIDQKILLRPGNTYSATEYNQTIRLLNDLEIFQYVRVMVVPQNDDPANDKLDCIITLFPNKKYDFSANIDITGGDIYTLGTAANVSIVNKNFLKGANKLTVTGSYGIELNQNKNLPEANFFDQFYLFSQNAGLNVNLTFPKFLLPVKQNKFSRTTVPNTFLEAGVNQLRRRDFFSLTSYNIGFGYRWRSSPLQQWIVKPAFVNILNLNNVSPSFQERMDSIPAIRNSYQETFVEGEMIEYIYNSELKNPRNYSVLKVGFEEAGLLMSGINALNKSIHPSAKNINFASYLRIDFDWRKYIAVQKSKLAFRFYGGVGIPYGSSSTLPYIKQYFVGGAYSIRGWRPRVLGPGSYNIAQSGNTSSIFADQTGDIKIELNGEYRFPILNLFSGAINLNGALFVDAGNIWLAKPSSQLPGAEFKFNKLYDELAMSYGAGLRFDLGGFLVLRTDVAFQAKKPYISTNNGWTIGETQFGSSAWRKENMNFNIAIGYPF